MTAGDHDVETQLMLLETPFGGGPHDRERQRAAAWLLANSERAYPVLLARVRERRAGAAIVELLGEFGRADSVPLLADLLDADEPMGRAAAQSLASNADPSALAVLREGLGKGGDRAVRCADALGARGDAAACPELRAAAAQSDARLRYHAIAAAVSPQLGCLSDDELAEIGCRSGGAPAGPARSDLLTPAAISPPRPAA
jgi:HEAT repeat protein